MSDETTSDDVTTVTRGPYTIVENAAVNDPALSFKAKGLLVWMLARPPDWTFHINHMSDFGPDGKTAVRSALDELIEQGYVRRHQERDDRGHFVRSITEIRASKSIEFAPVPPHTDFRSTDNPSTSNPSTSNPPLVSNEEVITELVITDRDNPPTPHTPPADLDAEWNEVWSWWPKHDGKHSARKAYRSQLRNYGQSRVEIMQGIKSFADHFVESGQKATFCPKLDSFLNDERWRDWADGPPKGHGPTDEELAKAADNAEYEAAKASVYARYPHHEPKWDDEGEQA